MLKTKDLYLKACQNSEDLHVMTDEERAKLQAHLRLMYLEIEKVCDRHSLRMMVGFGTVLGAIRHNGFIPWDDDMDLLMPREDYERFINQYAQELPKQFKIFAPNSKNGPIYRFAKVVDTTTRFLEPSDEDNETSGIFIDIFPLEYSVIGTLKNRIFRFVTMLLMIVSSSVEKYEKHSDVYKRLMCSSKAGKRTYYLRQAIGLLFSWKKSGTWYNMFDRFVNVKKANNNFSIPSGGPHIRNFVPRKVEQYLPVKKMRFDDIDVYVPNQPEQHCVDYYGDWTWIPPVEKRWQHFIKEIKFEV